MKDTVGNILKKWRNQHRYSQLQLAVELGISSKHISFIETGRSLPSKEMILKICSFLFIPKREINRALYSAGYAPIYAELSSSDVSLKPIFEAIEKMIQNHMPYPAIVLNQSWDVVMLNDSAQKLFATLGYSEYTNLIEALVADNPNNSKIINWHEVLLAVQMRLKQEIIMLGDPQKLQEYENQLSECLLSNTESTHNESEIVLSTQIQSKEEVLSFFSIVSQLGTVQDVTLSEYKIELMFPVDEITKKYYAGTYEKQNKS